MEEDGPHPLPALTLCFIPEGQFLLERATVLAVVPVAFMSLLRLG